jgi:hypothetical protein
MLRTSRDTHQLLRRQQQRLQGEELAQAGLERAVARLARDAGYNAEVWQISAAELGGREDAAVKIEVQSEPARPQARRVLVQVDYPEALERRIRHRHEALIELPERTNSP